MIETILVLIILFVLFEDDIRDWIKDIRPNNVTIVYNDPNRKPQLDFPSRPETHQIYTDYNNVVWEYDGVKWIIPVSSKKQMDLF